MLAVASLKRSLEFDPVEQGVKRKRAEIKLSSSTYPTSTTSPSPSKQQPIFPASSSKTPASKSSSVPSLTSADHAPVFTYTQTAQMCARLLREQDQSIREQYEQLLTTKLNEQYEQFIRYSHDSVYKNSSKEKLFHFGEQQSTDNSSSTDFSYVS